ncbi:GAF domain-containing protein [Nocardioides mangrovi]|uniref:GAF domain-containing protein n=1 Tax=Nocardioides mangrovi TaxID=2874580 RepID=A0ABS7UJM3_9ACTN|nr:GAF domain-containing protein [Nocardioides mangrovi]MBZ5740871.1 GAF domain-containing protein [Nocardioides mangrovi]
MTAVSSSELTSKLRSHGLHAPTGDDLRHDLWMGTTDPVLPTWAEACDRAGVPSDTTHPGLDDLSRIAAALVDMGGAAGLVGRSMGVRIATYRAIAARGSSGPAPAWDWARVALDTLLKGRAPRPERIAELLALDPFAPELRVELDQAASRVAQRLGAALGGVSIVLGSAQCLVGSYGGRGSWIAEAAGNPIEWSFCATSVRTKESFVVPDTHDSAVHRLNPTSVHDGVRAYAGAPLLTSAGEVLGNCCVIDLAPRDFTAEDVAVLETEAAAIVAELERRRDERLARAAEAEL